MRSPRKLSRASLALLAFSWLAPGTLAASCNGGTAPSTTLANGGFQTFNGQIYAPNGQPFVGRGINVSEVNMGDADQILATYKGLNMVRLVIGDYHPASYYADFINKMTSHGVVVVMDDHKSSTGLDSGGSDGVILHRPTAATELAFDRISLPHIRITPMSGTTNNEPAEAVYPGGPDNPARCRPGKASKSPRSVAPTQAHQTTT